MTEETWQQSGFAALEEQIDFIVTESTARTVKLRSTFQSARVVLEKLRGEIHGLLDKVSNDTTALRKIETLLLTRREQLLRQAAAQARELETAYDEMISETGNFAERKLTWWNCFVLIFVRKNAVQFREAIASNAKGFMQPRIEKAVNRLETDVRSMWPQLQDLLENDLSADLRKKGRQTAPDFAVWRRELSQGIQSVLVDTFGEKTIAAKVNRSSSQTSLMLRACAAIVIISSAIALFFTNRSPAVLTSTVTIGVVAFLALILLPFYHRRKIISHCRAELGAKRKELGQRFEQQFSTFVDAFCADTAGRVQSLNDVCEAEQGRYAPCAERVEELQKKFVELKLRLG